MGCQHSKQDDVLVPTEPGATVDPSSKKRSTLQRRSDRVTFRDDLTSDLIQHKIIEDIDEFFEFTNVIGTGHFGCVKRAISKKSGKEWAIKIVSLNNEVDKDALRNELNILKRLHHPQIVRVIASYEDKEQMYMVMQFCKGKSLYEHLYKDKHEFKEEEIRKIIRGLLRAIAFLHSNFITHRDLKLENLLLESEGQNCNSLKLCDFGLSTRFKRGEKLQKPLGTIDYIAPEVLDGEYNEKCDLWSVGVICDELFTGISPFHAATIDETMGKIFDGVLVFEDSKWKHFSPSAIHFIKSLVKEDIEKRLSAQQALDHKWLRDDLGTATAGGSSSNNNSSSSSIVKSSTTATSSEESCSSTLQNNKRLLLTNMLSFSRCRKMKQTALLSVALGISEDHIQQEMAAEVFHSMDKDKNGRLSREEFCSSLEECGISAQDASELFTRIDQTKTGNLNFLEFIAAVMDQREIGQSTIKEAFSLLDGEKTGRLSIAGLKDVFRHSLMADEVKEMIDSVDTSKDGYVDFDEFQEMFNTPNTPLAKVQEGGEYSQASTSAAGQSPKKLARNFVELQEQEKKDDSPTTIEQVQVDTTKVQLDIKDTQEATP
jgi:calcium-dependent protein kinase